MSFSDWFCAQTPERQKAALDHSVVCAKLGEARRTAPFSDETRRLSAEASAYYARWKDAP